MSPPNKKRRVEDGLANGDHSLTAAEAIAKALEPATDEDKRNWQGFCEIESEPAFFNVMLKEFGVRGVKVQEVFGLDDELLAMLPKPVYGLIFLFRYKTDDANDQEATCPENVWFANQIADFSCATVSLLNIVNNIPSISLGDNLQAFKDFTKDFPPALRGDAIVNFSFAKQIHNSFARKMDMLNIDLGLQNSYDDRNKPQKSNPGKKSSKVVSDDDFLDENAAFHFSAYVPIDDEVWKLDGLDRQPRRVGRMNGQDWLTVIAPVIQERMALYAAGEIEFNLLSLVKDPLSALQSDLASNIKAARATEAALDSLQPSWREEFQLAASHLSSCGPDSVLGVTEPMLMDALPSHDDEFNSAQNKVARLLELRRELSRENQVLRRAVSDELHSAREHEQQAYERRNDYAPAIRAWLKMLAQKDGLIKELIEERRARNGIPMGDG